LSLKAFAAGVKVRQAGAENSPDAVLRREQPRDTVRAERGVSQAPRGGGAAPGLRVASLAKVATPDRTATNREDGSHRPRRSPLEQKGGPAHQCSRARPRLPNRPPLRNADGRATSLRHCTTELPVNRRSVF